MHPRFRSVSFVALLPLLAACADDPYALLSTHDGYWTTEVESADLPFPATVVNDMHIDAETRRSTVYAQARIQGMTISPPQVGPGECTTTSQGATVCFHPDAVYLNGTGQELDQADGTGAWWVKHSWVVDGEGYDNCTLMPPRETYDDCIWAEGTLLEDGLTMRIGDLEEGPFNERRPLLDQDPVRYELVSFGVLDLDAEPTADGGEPALIWDCVDEVSAFDGQSRPCPEPLE
ncbi:MAG: hypothetical protein AAF602_12620 [Myxococcota bacterium]